MDWRSFLSSIFTIVIFLIIVSLLFSYFFLPYPGNDLFLKSGDVNAPSYDNSSIQFYSNMRFPDKTISYKISDCPIKKTSDMEDSFIILENLTSLNFYPVTDNEQVIITCSSETRESEQNGFFIAGEGGPLNITLTDNFNVIQKGKILLLRDLKCENPNVGIHELLHVLGFTHSQNPDSIMYEVSKCSQVITSDIVNEINRLYSTSSLTDLVVNNLTASTHGRYLDVSFSVVNHGLKESEGADAIILINEEEIERILS